MDSSTKSVVKLVMITPENNNKFYIMKKLNSSEWEAQWGRIQGDLNGVNQGDGQRKVYPINSWDKTYREKTGKGYTDVTHLYEIVEPSTNSPAATQDPTSLIQNSIVRQLMIDLQKYASIAVKNNYTVSSDNVTQLMVDEAQNELNYIKANIKLHGNVTDINNHLLNFFKIIPRKMSNVKDHLIHNLSDQSNVDRIQKMVADEQDTLDVMAGQVKLVAQQKKAQLQSQAQDTQQPSQISILEQMGLEIEPASGNEFDEIKKYAGADASKIRKVFKVIHKTSKEKYDKHANTFSTVNQQLFWHGSRNQNWFNILQTGLLIRPSGAIHTGSMFGDGIYFANKAAKSMGYSSFRGSYWTGGNDSRGYLALFTVNVGNQKHIHRHSSDCYTLNHSKIAKDGFDSVYAHGGADLRNDEFIVYMPEKCTISYLVEIG